MKVLAIETSAPRGSVAFVAEGEVVEEETFPAERGHSTTVFRPLEGVLEAAGKGLDWIVAGTGPGSYSGVRVGIAVANALSLKFGVRAVGISSLLAPSGIEGGDYAVIGDARRQTFFLAEVRAWRLAGEIALLEAGELERRVEAMREGGERVVTFDEAAPGRWEELGVERGWPRAAALAARCGEMTAGQLDALAGKPLEPIYLRAPYITTPRPR